MFTSGWPSFQTAVLQAWSSSRELSKKTLCFFYPLPTSYCLLHVPLHGSNLDLDQLTWWLPLCPIAIKNINNTNTVIPPHDEGTFIFPFSKEKKTNFTLWVCLLDRIQRQSCKTEDRVWNDDLSVYTWVIGQAALALWDGDLQVWYLFT